MVVGDKVIVSGRALNGHIGQVSEVVLDHSMPYLVTLYYNDTFSTNSTKFHFAEHELTLIPSGATKDQIEALKRILC